MLKYGSVCSGIEAASVAWESLGFQPQWFAETEPFPSAVLKHHWPRITNYKDFTQIGLPHGQIPDPEPIDLLVGGTPCQSFSVAGKGGGLADPRGNLAFEFFRLARRLRARWFVWENVPNVLYQNKGRNFAALLKEVERLGYGFAYRIFDAQYFGLAQRRRRVFLVGYFGDWRPPAAVLFEPESLLGYPAPRRKKIFQEITPDAGSCVAVDRRHTVVSVPYVEISHCLKAQDNPKYDPTHETYVIHGTQDPVVSNKHAHALGTNHGQENVVCYDMRGRDSGAQLEGPHPTANIRSSSGGSSRSYVCTHQVRRLTPLECERLQGFPDNFTLVPYRGKLAKDSPRYKAIGNSMAVPVMHHIGNQIEKVYSIKIKVDTPE